MEFQTVDKTNIDILFCLNRQLAEDENQSNLFIANRATYYNSFLSNGPIAFACLALSDKEAIGFYLYFYKFASYSGSRVLYIEDMFLGAKHQTIENKTRLIEHAIETSKKENCSRVEMRVLNTFSFGTQLIEDSGFVKINKWAVYRIDLKQ